MLGQHSDGISERIFGKKSSDNKNACEISQHAKINFFFYAIFDDASFEGAESIL